jgi:hypothetical protein
LHTHKTQLKKKLERDLSQATHKANLWHNRYNELKKEYSERVTGCFARFVSMKQNSI